MQRLLMLLLTVLAGVLPSAANAWWQPDWQYRKQVSVDTTPQGAAINESLGRLPWLVHLHTGNFTFDGANEKGPDIRLVAADGDHGAASVGQPARAGGERLVDDLGCTSVFVRYNTGRHISVNGRELSELLDALVRAWPREVEQIALVGHSMGGLVARSACFSAL